jgi:opacity protein-like surface antigen
MIFAALAVTPLCAQAAKRIYFAGYMGLKSYPPQDYKDNDLGLEGEIGVDDSISFAGAIGFKLTPQFRVEAELSHSSADISSANITNFGSFEVGGSLDSTIAMVNVYYDFDFAWRKAQPFIGAGLGYGWHEGGIDNALGFTANGSSEADGYVWQVGGGVRYPISDSLSLISAYRYMDGQDLEFSTNEEVDTSAHEVRVGLSWDLPFE